MAERSLNSIRKSVVERYKKDYPDEVVYGRLFSIYLLDLYSRLLYRIYKKANDK